MRESENVQADYDQLVAQGIEKQQQLNNQENNIKRNTYMDKLGVKQHAPSVSSTQTGTGERYSSIANAMIEPNDTDTVGNSSLSYDEPTRGKSMFISNGG